MLSFRPIGRNLFLFVDLFSAVKTRFLLSVEMTGSYIIVIHTAKIQLFSEDVYLCLCQQQDLLAAVVDCLV